MRQPDGFDNHKNSYAATTVFGFFSFFPFGSPCDKIFCTFSILRLNFFLPKLFSSSVKEARAWFTCNLAAFLVSLCGV